MAFEGLKVKEEEKNDEVSPETPVEEKKEEISSEVKEEQKPVETIDDYKSIAEARLKEIERLKADKRSVRSFNPIAETNNDKYTKAELRVFESLREDAFQDFLDANSQYRENDTLWEKFLGEYQDRISELDFAKRKNVPVTKRLFKERLESIHRSIGGVENLKEEGKKELLRSQSEAQILGAASGSGENVDLGNKPSRDRILPKKGHGFQDWIPANKRK